MNTNDRRLDNLGKRILGEQGKLAWNNIAHVFVHRVRSYSVTSKGVLRVHCLCVYIPTTLLNYKFYNTIFEDETRTGRANDTNPFTRR